MPGAFALRDVLAEFPGGRVVIAVTRPPFKCPPAPSETALMMHDLLVSKGVRDRSDITLVMPLPVPIPPSPDASQALLDAFAEHGITWMPERGVRALDPDRQVVILTDDTEVPYDLFLGIPVHVAPPVVVESGLTVNGWIPVDAATLATSYPDIYAVGDVTSVGTPKAGVFAESQEQGGRRRHRRSPPWWRLAPRSTVVGSATSSSATRRWVRSSRCSCRGRRPRASLRPRLRTLSRPTRRRSARRARGAGSARSGRTSDGPVPCVGHNGSRPGR